MNNVMTLDDTKAIELLQRKFYEYTKDDCKKAKGRDYICDHEIHYAFDYRYPNDKNYIGITCRFLYNNCLNKIIGFKVYELHKGANFVEGISTIGDGIEVGLVHETAFTAGYRTIKVGDHFKIEELSTPKYYRPQQFVEIV